MSRPDHEAELETGPGVPWWRPSFSGGRLTPPIPVLLTARPTALLYTPLAALLVVCSAPSAQAQDLADGFYLEDATDAAFALPVAVAFAPGGRMFVVEKRGVVWVVEDGRLQPEPFIDLTDEVLDQHDRGLLGIAIDPGFETNRRVYLSYVVDHQETADRERFDAFARVTSYAGRADDPSVAAPESRRVLIGETFSTGIPACYKSHTIGTLQVGADGTLLVGTGDAASYREIDGGGLYTECFGAGRLDPADDVGAFRSQRVESLAGKILRVDASTGRGLSSNPFWTGNPNDNASKVWALGLRNPYRFAVDTRAGSTDPGAGQPGTIYLGDVGYKNWEDLDIARGGENFGWPCYEGPRRHGSYPAAAPAGFDCDGPLAGRVTEPARTWHHRNAELSQPAGRIARAITGGAVNAGTRYPAAYHNTVFYGDYVQGWTAFSTVAASGELEPERLLGSAVGPVVNYTFDPVSEYVYLVDVVKGKVRRLRHADEGPSTVPVAAARATPAQGAVGSRVQFSPAGSFDPEGDALSYRWTFGDGNASSERAPVHAYAAPGVYAAQLAVSDGRSETTVETTVTVRSGSVPSVEIVAPTAAHRAPTGTAVRLRADVSDPDQTAESLFVRWTVTQVHDQHQHFDVFQASDAEADFVIPEHGLPGEQVYYRVRAEVRDAEGLTAADETTLFVTGDGGEADVTDQARPIASVPSPVPGRGSLSLAVLTDGVYAQAGVAADRQDFATYTGQRDRDRDWVGLEFDALQNLSRVTVQHGLLWATGGWFETTPTVQVRREGVWVDAVAQTASPGYRAADGPGYATYELRFAPQQGDAVRVLGPPGGTEGFVSVGELRAWALVGPVSDPETGLPDGWASADLGGPSGIGSASFDGGAFTVVGGGDVWGKRDRFHYAYHALDGDATVQTRVSALVGDADWSKAILMLRESAEADAPHVSIVLSHFGLHLHVRQRAAEATAKPVDDWDHTAPIWLRLDRAGDVVTARASLDGQAWWKLGDVRAPALAGPALVGLAVSAADYGTGITARAEFSDFRIQERQSPPTELPEEWTSADVGAPDARGSTVIEDGAFVVRGGGDIWSESDRMHYAYQQRAGVGSITARVSTPAGPHEWSKAGLMVRQSPEPGAPHVWFGFSQLGLHLGTRPSASAPSEQVANDWGAAGPEWLRLEREQTTVRALRSDDGETWTAFAEVELAAIGTTPVLNGLAVSAADFGQGWVATGRFSGVQVISTGTRRPTDGEGPAASAFGIETLFPNPATARATVRLTGTRRADVVVFDALGRQVLSQQATVLGTGDVSLDLTRMPAGLYLVRVQDIRTGETAVRSFSVVR